MTFEHPAILGLLVALPLLAWWLIRRERDRTMLSDFGERDLLALSSVIPSERIRIARQMLKLGALSLGILALARPQLGQRPASLAHTGRDVLVLLDLSRSMNATDAPSTAQEKVSRLDAAKRAAIEALAASPGDRVGLVVFGGSAFLQLPLTADHSAFRRFLDAATTDDLSDPATNLSRALSTAATTFEHEGQPGYQTVLLLSDGESLENDDIGPALTRLRGAGVPVFVIGVGTTEGSPIPADSARAEDHWHRDHIGRVVLSRLEEDDLRRAARETNGFYARWSPRVALTLGPELARLEKRTLSSRTTGERADRFQWPVGLALILLSIDPLLALRSPRKRTVAVAVLVAVLQVGCSSAVREIRRGEQSYRAGQYSDSYHAFQRALAAGGDPAVHYALGNALYRLRRYEEAAKSFREATAVPRLRQRSYYNLGNAYVRAAEEAAEKELPLSQGIAAYEEALRLDPADSAAKWNLELALKRRGDDRASGGSSGRGRSADYGRGDMNVPGYEGNPEAAVGAMAGGGYGSGEGESAEELSEAQARQLLEAVEREQLSSHQGRQAGRRESGQFDW
jgi:Ca-activated chloride channel homolog